MFKTFKFALFAASAFIINVSPAFAEPVTSPYVSVVSTAGLDLSSDAGRAELDHRLVTAAYEVCGTPSDIDLVGKNQVRQCRKDVLTDARAKGRQLADRGEGSIMLAARR